MLLEQLALRVGDVADRRRRQPLALVGQPAVGRRQLDERQVGGPEGQAQVDVEGARDPEAPRDLDRVVEADALLHLDRDHVHRLLDRLLQRRRAAELPIVILRLPDLVVADRVGNR